MSQAAERAEGAAPGHEWRNWSGNVTARPSAVARPTRVAELAELVAGATAAGRAVKAVGAGHSFTPIAATDGLQITLDGLTGVLRADRNTGLVTVAAGTRLRALNRTLALLGLALPNLGDIDSQSIAGALATGTHGTGGRYQGITADVRGLQLVLADGSVVDLQAGGDDPELFEAARLGLGALGVISAVTLQCVPAFDIVAHEYPAPLSDVLADLPGLVDAHDHAELFWFPWTDRALVKANRRLAPGADEGRPLPRWRGVLEDEILANGLFEAVCRVGAQRPALVPQLNAVAARALGERTYTAPSDQVFVSPRRVRFVESEYAVPRAAVPEILEGLDTFVRRTRAPILFPVEVRFLAADDVWLSTAYQQDVAYVAVHQFRGMPADHYLAELESLAAAHGGRPHWGKVHSLAADRLRELYPRFEDFRAVRDRVDPSRTFANEHLRRVLGD